MKLESGRRVLATARLFLILGYRVCEGELPAKQYDGHFLFYIGQCERIKPTGEQT